MSAGKATSIRSEDVEKGGEQSTFNQPNVDPDAEFGGTEARKKIERRLLLKIDLRMGILIVLYILNYIDRNNASAARLKGFEADLNLKQQEFPTLLSILYVGYIQKIPPVTCS